MRGRYKKTATTPEEQLAKKLEIIRNYNDSTDNGLEILIEVIQEIRPHSYRNFRYAQNQLKLLTDLLHNDRIALKNFQTLLANVFMRSDVSEVLTESGINSEYNFFQELSKRFRHKILPPLKVKGSFLYIINSLFYKKYDHRWVEEIDNEVWINLFELIEVDLYVPSKQHLDRLYYSLFITSNRISILSAEYDVQRCLTEKEQFLFIKQNITLHQIIESRYPYHSTEETTVCYTLQNKLISELDECEIVIRQIPKQIDSYGTSLHQTYVMLNIRKLIERIRMIIDMINHGQKVDINRTVNYFKEIVRNENTKNSIRSLIGNNIELLAYRIAENERNTGEHYITVTRREYWQMFRSAMGGGVIISFIAVIKSLLHLIKMAPFWQGFTYSINYAVGFIGIYATGSTLATKQPAMTASTIASSLDSKHNDSPNLPKLAILISEVVRSQTASFIGNLIIVFPLTLGVAWIWNRLFGFSIAEGAAAQALLDNQNPLKSLSILYACFTGVFLFLSGIISGYFDNLAVYGNIPERLREHPWLKRTFSGQNVERIAIYAGKHLGGIMGNLCLGFFLGMAAFMGDIFGILFDIRHITISTGQFAIGLQGLNFEVSTTDLVWTTIGIILVGFFNFLVSFALAFFTALASRKVQFKHYRRFMLYLLRLLFRYPLDFIRPPKIPRRPADFMRRKA